MKALPVYELTAMQLTLTPAEVERAIADPSSLLGVLRAALSHTKAAPEVTAAPEPAAVHATRAVKTAKPKGRGPAPHVYDCNECSRTFTSEKRLDNHIRKAHNGETQVSEE